MANGQLMIVTASEAGGFTVLIVTPEGLACMAASGGNLEVLEPEPEGVDG